MFDSLCVVCRRFFYCKYRAREYVCVLCISSLISISIGILHCLTNNTHRTNANGAGIIVSFILIFICHLFLIRSNWTRILLWRGRIMYLVKIERGNCHSHNEQCWCSDLVPNVSLIEPNRTHHLRDVQFVSTPYLLPLLLSLLLLLPLQLLIMLQLYFMLFFHVNSTDILIHFTCD